MTAALPDSELGDVVWTPGPEHLSRSRLRSFCQSVHHVDVPTLDAAARRDPAWYWAEVAGWLDFDWERAPEATVDQLDDPHLSRWFVGGRFNLADNAVDRWVRRGRGGDVALRCENEDGARRDLTFGELALEVDRAARGLRRLGVGIGDRVACSWA